MSTADNKPVKDPVNFVLMIFPLMSVILTGFLIIGIALPVLPHFVQDQLGFDTFTVGLVTGTQFAASLLARFYAGAYADTRGGRQAIWLGLASVAVGGLFYVCAFASIANPKIAISLLLVGRAIIGGAESFIITGGMALGLSSSGPKDTGRVIAWVGTAMFAAFALGAPIGTFIFERAGFFWIAIATVMMPFASIIVVSRFPNRVDGSRNKGSMTKMLSLIWLPGLGAAFNGVGFSALISFAVLLFSARDWGMAWLPVTAFAVALIAARLTLGQLVDQIGGIKVGALFTGVCAAGQLLLWMAGAPWLAAIGAAMTGAGWAMVYPAFGAEAVRRAGQQNKGLAMAAYSAFPDLAIGVASPTLGLLATGGEVGTVFLWSGIFVLIAVPLALVGRRAD
ncbi:putative MFS family arabinose efflux permease [Rhizobium sp. PP-WC-2G-219]|nr:putative MFS family arabinose efflux permease [Rhizobium sp. PP-WC-1G-195]TCL88965.1 putative MFS family arabinose efflux permease [Rhizobium sp. PP-WC-2G-219]